MSKELDSSSSLQQWSNYSRSHAQHDEQYTDPITSRQPQSYAQPNTQAKDFNPNYSNNNNRLPDRTAVPTRAATMKHPDPDRSLSANVYANHARSEDLSHSNISPPHPSTFSGSSPRPSPAFLVSNGSSRPTTPGNTSHITQQLSSGNDGDGLAHKPSNDSLSSGRSESSSQSNQSKPVQAVASSSVSSGLSSACVDTHQYTALLLMIHSTEHAQRVEKLCRDHLSGLWEQSFI
jgi:hypothetical protein